MRARRLCPRILQTIACAAALIAGWLGPIAAGWLGSSAASPKIARAEDPLPEPICWRQQAFSIPFKVTPVDSPDQQPGEVRLYVSANQGVQWEIAQRVSPHEHSFTFRAPHDGEYWFQIRTTDRQGQVSPEVSGRPELRVIVDTLKPRLDFTAARGEAGEVKATWQAVDPLLNADSFKLEYQTAAGTWRPIAVDRPQGSRDRSTTTGNVTWYPDDAPAGSVAVRAEISDQAGNVTESHAQADLPGTAGRRDLTATNGNKSPAPTDQNWTSTPSQNWSVGPSLPSNSSLPSNTHSPTNSAGPNYRSPNTAANSASTGPRSTPSSFSPPDNYVGSTPSSPQKPLAGDPCSTAWPADRSADQPLGRNPIPSDDNGSPAFSSGRSPYVSNQSNQTPYVSDQQRTSSTPSQYVDRTSPFAGNQSPYTAAQAPYAAAQSRYGDVASRAVEDVSPPIHNQALPERQNLANDRPWNSPASQSPGPSLSIPSGMNGTELASRGSMSGGSSLNNMLPPGERPRMVNSRSFDLDYEVDGIGPSGIAKVELWGTRDGGRTWTSYGVDNDNRSPIRANVDGEGLYGFRMVVQSGNGLGGVTPRSGDAPDLWIMVDLTKPNVRLIDATAGTGPQSGELVLRWEANDSALAARPITLYFSDHPGGPWSIIAAGLENTGGYAWRVDSRAPDRIYLRIEARDEAGNIGAFEAAESVTLDRVRPEGHIRAVRSTGDTAEVPSNNFGR
jgi:hypothetical protein